MFILLNIFMGERRMPFVTMNIAKNSIFHSQKCTRTPKVHLLLSVFVPPAPSSLYLWIPNSPLLEFLLCAMYCVPYRSSYFLSAKYIFLPFMRWGTLLQSSLFFFFKIVFEILKVKNFDFRVKFPQWWKSCAHKAKDPGAIYLDWRARFHN